MTTLLLSVFLTANCFFTEFKEECVGALDFFKVHKEIRSELKRTLHKDELDIAMAIVAPEVGMYSMVEDIVEYKTMCLLYIQFGIGDFSIGCFQMKPSFAEALETKLKNNHKLRKKHSNLIITCKNEKETRKTRIDRLITSQWQAKYLAAFIDIVKMQTHNLDLQSLKKKVMYWATLYNSGLNLSESEVEKLQSMHLFPRSIGEYNYGEVAWDFYMHMNNIEHK